MFPLLSWNLPGGHVERKRPRSGFAALRAISQKSRGQTDHGMDPRADKVPKKHVTAIFIHCGHRYI